MEEKRMKKLKISAALLCSVLFLSACGGKEQSVTYQMVTETGGMEMTDTMTLNAKGDTIQNITEVIELDMTSFDDDTYALMGEYYDELIAMYQAVDGVECTGEDADKIFTITISIDATTNAIDELSNQGLMEIEGESDGKFSLEASTEALEASGFEKVE